MGITRRALKCFLIAKKSGVSFKSIITLGRQNFLVNNTELEKTAASYGISLGIIPFSDQYSEPFYKALGAEKIDSIDFSNYEKATIIHDMNLPIPEELKNKYDCLFDGGTLEHIFNFPQAIKNCMQMIKVGGHFLSVNPANNQMGHGLYQFSPELYFRVFSKENGFEIVNVFVCTSDKDANFYEVKDPDQVKSGVTLINNKETDLIVIAKRIAIKDIFTNTPQQSDYAATWQTVEEKESKQVMETGLKSVYNKIVPPSLRDVIWELRNMVTNRKTYKEDLGAYNSKHFTKE